MKTKISKTGDLVIQFSKKEISDLNLKVGDSFSITEKNGKIVLTKLKNNI